MLFLDLVVTCLLRAIVYCVVSFLSSYYFSTVLSFVYCIVSSLLCYQSSPVLSISVLFSSLLSVLYCCFSFSSRLCWHYLVCCQFSTILILVFFTVLSIFYSGISSLLWCQFSVVLSLFILYCAVGALSFCHLSIVFLFLYCVVNPLLCFSLLRNVLSVAFVHCEL